MKKMIFSSLILSLLINTVTAQEIDSSIAEAFNTESEIIPFYAVEIKPEFPGGEDEMIKFLTENLEYPNSEMQGLVIVSFIINTDGRISNIRILKSLAPHFDKEAIRVVKMMPKWNPGFHQGQNARVPINLPVRFTLEFDDDEKSKQKKRGKKKK